MVLIALVSGDVACGGVLGAAPAVADSISSVHFVRFVSKVSIGTKKKKKKRV